MKAIIDTETRYLTKSEQRIMHKALRASTRPVEETPPAASDLRGDKVWLENAERVVKLGQPLYMLRATGETERDVARRFLRIIADIRAEAERTKRLYDALSAMMYGWDDDSVRTEAFATLKEAEDAAS